MLANTTLKLSDFNWFSIIGFSILSLLVFFLEMVLKSEQYAMFFLLMYCTFIALYLILTSIYIKELNLLFLFSASYLIPIYYYHFGGKIITTYSHSNELYLLNKYLLLYALFFSIVTFFLGDLKSKTRQEISRYSNPLIFYINILICILISLFSKSGESIFSSGGYGVSEIENIGGFAIGEYFILFFLIAFKFSGESIIYRILLLSTALLYILVSFSFGLRNEFIQICILFLILFYKEKKTFIFYILLVLFAIYFSSLFSLFRSNPVEFLQKSIWENLSFKNIFTPADQLYISHQGDVIHSSSRLISFTDNGIVALEKRISSFFSWLSSSFIPFKFLPEEANMASYLKDDFPTGGGGNPFSYFYFWFSYVGVLFFGSFVGMILRGYISRVSSIYGIYFIIIVATFPRWLSYSPINFIKMGLYGLIIFIGFVFIHASFKGERMKDVIVV